MGSYMKRNLTLAIIFAIALTGCAATVSRSVIAMKISSNEAHVSLGEGEAKKGDSVLLYFNDCKVHRGTYRTTKPVSRTCKKVYKGTGTITEILNDHYSVVQFQKGVDFGEGDVIEVESH